MKRKPYFSALVFKDLDRAPFMTTYFESIDVLKDVLKHCVFECCDIFVHFKGGKEKKSYNYPVMLDLIKNEIDEIDTLKKLEEIRL